MVRRRSLLVAAVLIATGCTSTPELSGADGQVELVWATGAITADSGAASVTELWNELHPVGPHVRVEKLPPAADDQHDLMAVELNARISEFDILDVDLVWTSEFAESGWLVDLEDIRTEIEQVSLDGPVQSAVWDGRLWAAPFTTDVGLLYYRKDLVEKPPATWKELADLGFQLGPPMGIAPFVADGMRHEGLVVQYLEYLWGAGGDIFDPTCETVLFQEEPARRAAEFMRTAYHTGFYAPGFDVIGLEQAREVFQAGQAVFLRSWPYAYRLMNGGDKTSRVAGKIGIAPLPTFDGQGAAAGLGGHNLAVSRFSPHIDAAKDFVLFVSTSPEVQRMLAQRHSLAPTMTSVYDELADDPLMAELKRVLPQARPRPLTPEWASISEEIQQQIFATYTGNKDPAAAVAAIRKFLNATGARC